MHFGAPWECGPGPHTCAPGAPIIIRPCFLVVSCEIFSGGSSKLAPGWHCPLGEEVPERNTLRYCKLFSPLSAENVLDRPPSSIPVCLRCSFFWRSWGLSSQLFLFPPAFGIPGWPWIGTGLDVCSPPSPSRYGQKEMVMVGRSFVAERPKEERGK